MRERKKYDGLTVQAIAGTHVVLLGMDMAEAQSKGVLGFAVKREDHSSGEQVWMRGMKTFEETDPGLGPGGQISTREHPVQSFQWADYSVEPGQQYTYRVVALRGKPTNLTEGETVPVTVETELREGSNHSVYFNRGAAASQEYARRFQNKKPSEVGEPAYRWLSRGLVEALLEFISKANGAKYGLYGAVYEFLQPAVLQAIKAAHQSNAEVKIVYDAAGEKVSNEDAIKIAGIKSLCFPRSNTLQYAHNKFFVLTHNGKPVEVWTGSTNLTENGIYGHSNIGHIVRDKDIAQAFMDYWEQLYADIEGDGMKTWTVENTPAPPDNLLNEMTPVFSPRRGLKALDWYKELAAGARKGLFMTFAFGMNKRFVEVYEQNDGVLRFALMDKKGLNAAQIANTERVRRLPNTIVAVGNNIKVNAFDRWLKETYSIVSNVHVPFIHTKYMIVDPLSDDPVVVSGSANFSDASTDTNDENMLVIRGNKRVADIYLGEFMRLYSHYAFREALQANQLDENLNPSHLIPDDTWRKDYFKAGSGRALRREYFSSS